MNGELDVGWAESSKPDILDAAKIVGLRRLSPTYGITGPLGGLRNVVESAKEASSTPLAPMSERHRWRLGTVAARTVAARQIGVSG